MSKEYIKIKVTCGQRHQIIGFRPDDDIEDLLKLFANVGNNDKLEIIDTNGGDEFMIHPKSLLKLPPADPLQSNENYMKYRLEVVSIVSKNGKVLFISYLIPPIDLIKNIVEY